MAAARNVGTSSPSPRIAPDYVHLAESLSPLPMPKGATPSCRVHQGADFIRLPSHLIANKRRPFSHWVKLTWARTWLTRATLDLPDGTHQAD